MIETEPTAVSDGTLTCPEDRLAELERRVAALEAVILRDDLAKRRVEAGYAHSSAGTAVMQARRALDDARIRLEKMVGENWGDDRQRASAAERIRQLEVSLDVVISREAEAKAAKDALYL